MINTSTDLDSMLYAVIEGICFGIKDGFEAVHSVSKKGKDIYLVGGGSKSNFWAELISTIINHPIIIGKDSEFGPAIGVSRLAMLATNKYKNSEIIQNMEKINECYPLNNMSSQLNERYCKWKEIVSANIGIAKKIME